MFCTISAAPFTAMQLARVHDASVHPADPLAGLVTADAAPVAVPNEEPDHVLADQVADVGPNVVHSDDDTDPSADRHVQWAPRSR